MEEEKKETGETLPENTTTTDKTNNSLVYNGENNLLEKAPEQKYDVLADSLGKISTSDTVKNLGETASQNIQNVNIPKIKTKSLADIFSDPEFEGKRGSLVGNAILSTLGQAAGRVGGVDLGSQSRLGQYNDEQWQNYSDMTRDRDRTAFDTNVSDIQAGNARDVNQALQTADTVAQKELERYGLFEDLETQKNLLNKLINDLPEFQKLPPETKVALVGYQQALNGDMTAMDALTNAYGPGIVKKIDSLLQTIGKKMGWVETETPTSPTLFSLTGHDWTYDELADMRADEVAGLIYQLPEEERQGVINALAPVTSSWGKKDFVKDINEKLRVLNENAALEGEHKEEEENIYSEFISNWSTNFDEALKVADDSSEDYDKRRKAIKAKLDLYDDAVIKSGYNAEADDFAGLNEQIAKLNVKQEELAGAQDAKTFDKNAKKLLTNLSKAETLAQKIDLIAGMDIKDLTKKVTNADGIKYTDTYKELEKIVRDSWNSGVYYNSAELQKMNNAIDKLKSINPDLSLNKYVYVNGKMMK